MKALLFIVGISALAATTTLQGQVRVKHIQTDQAVIASAVWAGDTLYVSGQVASPTVPADPNKGTPDIYGDTREQVSNVLGKIQKILQDQGLDMKDVVKMTIFMVADHANGKMDFEGMNTEFGKVFGTKEQPNKPARTTVQVAALARPGALIEVDLIAVKSKSVTRSNARPPSSIRAGRK